MPQFTDSVLFLFVRALDPTVMGSVLRFTYLTQVIKGNGFRLRAEYSGWPGMLRVLLIGLVLLWSGLPQENC